MPFTPPFPERHVEPLTFLQRIRAARRNFLEVWQAEDFESSFISLQMLSRQLAVCNSPDTVREAFVDKAAIFERKSPQMRHALRPLIGDGLFISDGAVWQQRRRIVAPVVHGSRMDEFAPVMVEAALETRARWAALPPATEINMLSEMARLTAEIICRTIFGRALGREHAFEVVDAFTAYQKQIGQIDPLSLLGLPDWLPRPRGRAIHAAVERIDTVMTDVIQHYRRRTHSAEGGLLRHLMNSRDAETGSGLDDRALRDEATVIFMAGHETTANTLAWCWYLLSQATTKERALHAELDLVLADRAPTLEDVPDLPYTRAVVEEALRLYPPVPLLAREAREATEIDGNVVRRGAILLVVPWLLHRRPKFWRHPDSFIPERFLPDARRKPVRYSYVPFSTGPRVCAGLTFGLTEAILCLATLAQSFRPRLRPKAQVLPVCRLTLRPEGDGLPMTVEPRI